MHILSTSNGSCWRLLWNFWKKDKMPKSYSCICLSRSKISLKVFTIKTSTTKKLPIWLGWQPNTMNCTLRWGSMDLQESLMTIWDTLSNNLGIRRDTLRYWPKTTSWRFIHWQCGLIVTIITLRSRQNLRITEVHWNILYRWSTTNNLLRRRLILKQWWSYWRRFFLVYYWLKNLLKFQYLQLSKVQWYWSDSFASVAIITNR